MKANDQRWVDAPVGITETAQFKKIVVRADGPLRAFEMWVAIWTNNGHHFFIGAPTLDLLGLRWQEITGATLDRTRAQHVAVADFPATEEAEQVTLSGREQVTLSGA